MKNLSDAPKPIPLLSLSEYDEYRKKNKKLYNQGIVIDVELQILKHLARDAHSIQQCQL